MEEKYNLEGDHDKALEVSEQNEARSHFTATITPHQGDQVLLRYLDGIVF